MRTVAVVDYGMGNIGSVVNALDQLGVEHVIAREPGALADAAAIVLPGVGAFHAAMENIRSRGLEEALTEHVIVRRTPFLGICLGLQLIAQDSTELGFTRGLGWIDGHVTRIEPQGALPVPHVGWNDVQVATDAPLFARLTDKSQFYFDHGFALQCAPELVTATCEYGGSWVAAIQSGNIHAVQFHPEKSQRSGLRLLRNFFVHVDQLDRAGV